MRKFRMTIVRCAALFSAPAGTITAANAARKWMEEMKVNENFEKIKGRSGEAEKLICENRERPVTPSCEEEQ